MHKSSSHIKIKQHHLPLFGCICINLQDTPSNLFSCLLFSLEPSSRVSVTNFLIISIQWESFCKVEAFARETMISDSVKFSKRWSTLLERIVQCLTLKTKTHQLSLVSTMPTLHLQSLNNLAMSQRKLFFSNITLSSDYCY